MIDPLMSSGTRTVMINFVPISKSSKVGGPKNHFLGTKVVKAPRGGRRMHFTFSAAGGMPINQMEKYIYFEVGKRNYNCRQYAFFYIA